MLELVIAILGILGIGATALKYIKVVRIVKEVAELVYTASVAVEDGKLTKEELEKVIKELSDVVVAFR